MAEYIDKEKLRQAMFQEAFAKDSDLQRWDSGCWIRYKLFENVVESIPIADVQPVVRCINCKYYEGLACCKLIGDCGGTNWFCGWGEPKEET